MSRRVSKCSMIRQSSVEITSSFGDINNLWMTWRMRDVNTTWLIDIVNATKVEMNASVFQLEESARAGVNLGERAALKMHSAARVHAELSPRRIDCYSSIKSGTPLVSWWPRRWPREHGMWISCARCSHGRCLQCTAVPRDWNARTYMCVCTHSLSERGQVYVRALSAATCMRKGKYRKVVYGGRNDS